MEEDIEGDRPVNIESIVASWSDISIIYSFYKHYALSPNLDEAEKLNLSSGLKIFFADEMHENSPDILLNKRRLQCDYFQNATSEEGLASRS